MHTYTTLDGGVLDLSGLTRPEKTFFKRCYDDWRKGVSWGVISNLVTGMENPLLKATKGRVTNEVWEHPLFQAVRDIEDRAGIKQGELKAENGANVDADPLADEWIDVSAAALAKVVTIQAVHYAIKRHKLIAVAKRRGGKWLQVSQRSLDGWQPDVLRQTAGRTRAAR